MGMPVLYLLIGLMNRLIGLLIGTISRHLLHSADWANPKFSRHRFAFSFLHWPSAGYRRDWPLTPGTAILVGHGAGDSIVACVLLMLLNRGAERYLLKRRRSYNLSGSTSVLRLFRRMMDGLVLFAGLLFSLYRFGINPTAALAGLGVGGIAVALAAQKTLENVIGGISLIADQAVRSGDALKLGDVSGTVEDVGLRSTRIRTLDRTLISVPNGQVANMSLETLSARDKFWFHPLVSLRYETTSAQLRSVITALRKPLAEHSNVDSASVRVRFLRFGAFSLDVDIFAYLFASDWNHFLEIQEELLFGVMDVVQRSGAEFAFPSQTTYLAADARETNPPDSCSRPEDAVPPLHEHNVHSS